MSEAEHSAGVDTRRKTLVGKEAGTADLDISEQVLLGQPFQVVLEQSPDLRLVQLQKKLQQRPPAAETERRRRAADGTDGQIQDGHVDHIVAARS